TQVSPPTSRGGATRLAPGRSRMAVAMPATWLPIDAGAVTATVTGVLASVAKSRCRASVTCRAEALSGRTLLATEVKRIPREGLPATTSTAALTTATAAGWRITARDSRYQPPCRDA